MLPAPLPSSNPLSQRERIASPGANRGRLLIGAASVLLGEYVVLSHRVDAHSVLERGGIWRVAGEVGYVAPLIITTAAVWFALFRLAPLGVCQGGSSRVAASLGGGGRSVSRLPWLALHAIAYAALLYATEVIFGSRNAPPVPAALCLLGWTFLVLLTAASSLLGILGGTRWLRVLHRDLAVVGPPSLLAWVAGLVSASTWYVGARFTLTPVTLLLRLISVEAASVSSRYLLHADSWTMVISPGCSGYEGFGVAIAIIAAYLVRFRRELDFPKALAAVPMGVLAVWLANVVRFVLLSLVGDWFGPSAAVASFHSKASWLLSASVALGVVAVTRKWTRQPLTSGAPDG